jgi:hypothetical protein
MNNCLESLIGLKSLCGTAKTQPVFFIDDIEGLNQSALAKLATAKNGSGAALAKDLIESSVRLILADIDSLIPTNYKINNVLTSICSSCTFTGFFQNSSHNGSGIIIKNISNSRFSTMLIETLKIKIDNTGTFTIKIADSNGKEKLITEDFVAMQEFTLTNIGFETFAKQVSISFIGDKLKLYSINCPTNSTCGCGGTTTTVPLDVIVTGMDNGVENTVQYAFIPCVQIKCSYENIICDLVQSTPRLFGLALLYLFASKAFEENLFSERVNRTASFEKEYKQTEGERYYKLYRERLTGNTTKKISGITNVLDTNLKAIKDKCVTCNSPLGIAWATG